MTSHNPDEPTADARFAGLAPTPGAVRSPDDPMQAYRRDGGLLYVSGQVATVGRNLVAAGVVGADISLDEAIACARQCAINVLARIQESLGSLQEVEALLKITVFVASAPGFRRQPEIADAASSLLVDVLGPNSRHARSAIGVSELPIGSPVEIEAIVRCR